MRALAVFNGLAADDERLFAAARGDRRRRPVCLDPRARIMAGIGERLGPALRLEPLPAVLVNPGVAVPTPRVFAALGLARGATAGFGPAAAVAAGRDASSALRAGRNDLQPSAESLAPEITEALAQLSASGADLARMSGSGATCFALYPDRHAAARAARALKAARPGWWVRATYLR